MTYFLNPHKHVKIWLSNNRDVFLNQENQLRLVKMRAINPTDTIHFVYSSVLLSQVALNDLHAFCDKHKILALSVDDDIIPAISLENIDELNLIKIYQQEVTALGQGGNLAAASDALRWLEGIYRLGVYSDLDVLPNTSKLSESIEVQAGILTAVDSNKLFIDVNAVIKAVRFELNKNPGMNFFAESTVISVRHILEHGNEKNVHNISLNNDVFAVVGNDAQTKAQITRIQQAIFAAHQGIYSYVNDTNKNVTRLTQLTNKKFADIVLQSSAMLAPYAIHLAQNQKKMAPLSNIIVQRQALLAECEPLVYCHALSSQLGCPPNVSEEEKLKIVANFLRKELASVITTFQQVPKTKFTEIALQRTFALLDIHDDKEFLLQNLVEICDQILISSVVITTGPSRVQSALFNDMNYVTENELKTHIMPYSLKHYGFMAFFQTHNTLSSILEPVSSEADLDVNALSKPYEAGMFGDQSWAVEGAQAVKKRETAMHASALQVQSLFRGYRIQKALQKLENISLEQQSTPAQI